MARHPTSGIGYWLAIGVLILGLFMLVLAHASAAEYRVPQACAALADRYGLPRVMSSEQAASAVAQLDQYKRWPGVRICRNAIRREWRL